MPGEQNVAAKLDRGRVLAFTSAGGAKPIAGRGGLEGFTPPHRFKARTAASDGHTAFTRARAKRRGQVCGEVTVRSDGQGKHAPRRGAGLQFTSSTAIAVPLPLIGATADAVLTSSTAIAVPLPLIGEGLSAVEDGLIFLCPAPNNKNTAANGSIRGSV